MWGLVLFLSEECFSSMKPTLKREARSVMLPSVSVKLCHWREARLLMLPFVVMAVGEQSLSQVGQGVYNSHRPTSFNRQV